MYAIRSYYDGIFTALGIVPASNQSFVLLSTKIYLEDSLDDFSKINFKTSNSPTVLILSSKLNGCIKPFVVINVFLHLESIFEEARFSD